MKTNKTTLDDTVDRLIANKEVVLNDLGSAKDNCKTAKKIATRVKRRGFLGIEFNMSRLLITLL